MTGCKCLAVFLAALALVTSCQIRNVSSARVGTRLSSSKGDDGAAAATTAAAAADSSGKSVQDGAPATTTEAGSKSASTSSSSSGGKLDEAAARHVAEMEHLKQHARLAAAHTLRRNAAFVGYQEAAAVVHEIVLTTKHGSITIRPRPDLAPRTVEAITALAAHPDADYGSFIRHEPVPPNWGKDGFRGPPYALLGGTLRTLPAEPPLEGRPPLAKGMVAMIPGSKDFFIALADHPEWGAPEGTHTVWGEVRGAASWKAIAAIPLEPFTPRTDGGITTRWLDEAAVTPFKLQLAPLQTSALEAAAALMGLDV